MPRTRITVELALRHLAEQPMTRDEALAMRGARAIGEIPGEDYRAGKITDILPRA